MKPRNTKYEMLVRQKIIRRIADRDKCQINDEWRRFFSDDTPPAVEDSKPPFTHIKAFRRGDNGVVPPDGCDYLLVVAHETDGNGDWLTADVQAVQSIRELKALRQIVATSDNVVVKASSWFEHVAAGLGLRHLTTEWGRL